MKPFGCPVAILNTLDHLGKFKWKADEGFLVGYSVNSKAFRVLTLEPGCVGNKMHKAFPLSVKSSHCQKKFPLLVKKGPLLKTRDATVKKIALLLKTGVVDPVLKGTSSGIRACKYKTAQELWAAILKTFGGNEATKKTKKNLLKQQYGNFKAEGSETMEQTFNRLQAIVSHLEFIDIEIEQDDLNQKFLTNDLYNHLKVYESEVKKKSKSNSQNMAFISSAKNSSENEEVNTASIPTASTYVSPTSANIRAASISQDTACAYIASQSNGSQIKFEEITQIDEDDMEEIDIKWNMDLLSMRANRFWKKTGKKISIQGTDVAGFDKSKVECFNCHKMGHFAMEVGWDWSFMANEEENHALVADEEAPIEFALMAKTSAECEVEARLVEFKNQEVKYYEKIRGLEFKVESRATRIESLTNEIELLKKEKEGLDNKLTGFQTASKDLDSLLESQRSNKNKEGLGYSAVPPLLLKPSSAIDSTSNDLQNKNPSVTKTGASPSNIGNSQNHIDDKGYWDSGCSRHMTGNISYLSDYEPFDGGYVSFGQGGCKITSKGTIKTGKLEFENVYFVKDLKYNLFSVSQICDNKNSVLFTDSECIVLGRDFKLIDDTNDETSGILRNFITEIENLKELKNGVAERRNRTFIEEARIMLADAKLLVTFWAEAVNMACFVQNRVLVNKSQNKTPYELFNGRTPAIGFLKPFGCYVMILNTLDNLGKFEAKGDEGTKEAAGQDVKKDVSSLRYIVLPNWFHETHVETSTSSAQDACNADAPESSGNSNLTATLTNPLADHMETLAVETPIPTISSPVLTACLNDSPEPSSDTRLISKRVTSQDETPSLDNILTLTNRFENILGVTTNTDDTNGVEANLGNMETTITTSPTPTLRIHKDHPKSQIIGPVDTPIQTRYKSKEMEEQSFIATIPQKTNPSLLQFCLFSCFLSQVEPMKISDALQDPSWVEVMKEELFQFKIQNVWSLVDCPKGVRPIGTR
nr:hypothetical protein [Tanacetum cinerariifolium]